VGEDEDIEHAAERLLQATLGPVLTDVSIGGGAVRRIAPERPGDVLVGQPLVVAVELEPDGGILEVGGRLAGRRKDWSTRVEVLHGSLQQTQLPVGALFGREAIEDQEMHLAAAGHGGAVPILAVIEKIGLRHRITSRRTSLVAISEEPTVDPKEPWRRQRLAVEMPAEVSAEGVGLLPAKAWTLLAGTYSEEELCVGTVLPPRRATAIVGDPGRGKMALGAVLGSERRMGTDRSPLARRRAPRNVRARCARLEDDLLVIEFQVPCDGFQLPGTGVRLTVRFKGRRKVEAEIDPERSTRPGRYDAEMTLRLALRTVDGSHWPRTDATVVITPPTLTIPGTPEVPFVVLQVKIG